MRRVTPGEVKAIMDSCSLTDPQVIVFIETANVLLNEVYAGQTASDAKLKELERWLSAHLIAVSRERQTTEEKLGDASAVFSGKFGEGLKMTSYGQVVLTLDQLGIFGNLGKRKASITAVKQFDE